MVETIEDRQIRKKFGEGYSKLRDFNGSLLSIESFERFVDSVSNQLSILKSERNDD